MNAFVLTAEQVAMNKMVTGEDRGQFLGKSVKGYLDPVGYHEYIVEDTYPDTVFSAAVVLHREAFGVVDRRFGILFNDGFAIVLPTEDNQLTLDTVGLYKSWLEQYSTRKLSFDCGIEVRVSKDLVKKLKTPVLAIQDKFRAYEGVFGRLKEAKPLKAFQPNDKGCIRTELEDGALTVKIDTRAVMFVVEMAADYTDYVLKKAVALMSLLDFSDFAYKAKEKMARFKKEVEDPLK